MRTVAGGGGLSSSGMARGLAACIVVLSISACNPIRPSGAEALTQVADLVKAGRLADAVKIADAPQGDTNPGYLDKNDVNFCSRGAFEYRLNQVGYMAAQEVIELANPHHDRVYRYAMANRSLPAMLSGNDGMLKFFCAQAPAEITEEYDSIRLPLAMAIQNELDALKVDAVGEVGAANLEKASNASLAKFDRASEASLPAMCREDRAMIANLTTPIGSKNAMEAAVRITCDPAGL